ncbi:hypothetical protein [Actinokineospora sp. HUAS TT18]|uniref:hypothetical protein n=1 Tax=Actinokineospora sp. HUAS TT18 TaxID=3447451 RepID=UPI003F528507
MTTTDSSRAVAVLSELSRVHTEIRTGPDDADLEPAQTRTLLTTMAAAADLLGEMCTDLLLRRRVSRHERRHVEEAQDAAAHLSQHCRWAATHVH